MRDIKRIENTVSAFIKDKDIETFIIDNDSEDDVFFEVMTTKRKFKVSIDYFAENKQDETLRVTIRSSTASTTFVFLIQEDELVDLLEETFVAEYYQTNSLTSSNKLAECVNVCVAKAVTQMKLFQDYVSDLIFGEMTRLDEYGVKDREWIIKIGNVERILKLELRGEGYFKQPYLVCDDKEFEFKDNWVTLITFIKDLFKGEEVK